MNVVDTKTHQQKKKKKGGHGFEIFEHNLLEYLSLKTQYNILQS